MTVFRETIHLDIFYLPYDTFCIDHHYFLLWFMQMTLYFIDLKHF